MTTSKEPNVQATLEYDTKVACVSDISPEPVAKSQWADQQELTKSVAELSRFASQLVTNKTRYEDQLMTLFSPGVDGHGKEMDWKLKLAKQHSADALETLAALVSQIEKVKPCFEANNNFINGIDTYYNLSRVELMRLLVEKDSVEPNKETQELLEAQQKVIEELKHQRESEQLEHQRAIEELKQSHRDQAELAKASYDELYYRLRCMADFLDNVLDDPKQVDRHVDYSDRLYDLIMTPDAEKINWVEVDEEFWKLVKKDLPKLEPENAVLLDKWAPP